MPKTVLIVEDDSDTREIYLTALTERGYDVLIATHGAEGVHIARKHHPDLILLDIRMPVMDGWQAVCYLRSFPQTRKIPICGISAYAVEHEELAQMGRVEFESFLTKPIDPRDVVAQVEAMIGPPRQGMPAYAPAIR